MSQTVRPWTYFWILDNGGNALLILQECGVFFYQSRGDGSRVFSMTTSSLECDTVIVSTPPGCYVQKAEDAHL